MTSETEPAQMEEIVRAIEEAVGAAEPAPDPWWRAGIDDVLDE